jgi:hypothetical protein
MSFMLPRCYRQPGDIAQTFYVMRFGEAQSKLCILILTERDCSSRQAG